MVGSSCTFLFIDFFHKEQLNMFWDHEYCVACDRVNMLNGHCFLIFVDNFIFYYLVSHVYKWLFSKIGWDHH